MEDRAYWLLRQGRRDGDPFLYLSNYITDEATKLALKLLREQNYVSQAHADLVRAMAATTTDSVLGRLPGRYGIVAPVGAAKTTTLACVARAIELNAPEDVGMLILQERVAAGAETIERLLIERLGMDRGAIAHVFRRDAEGNPGAEPEEALNKRFVIATHARARMRSIVPLLTFRDRPRAALVDEVLYSGHGSGSTVRRAKSLLGWLLAFDDHPELSDLAEWADTVRGEIRGAVDLLRAQMGEAGDKVRDGYVKLTPPYQGRAGYWTASLNGKAGRKRGHVERVDRSEGSVAASAVRLIESLATSPETRIVVKATSEEGGGILQHRKTLPPEMKNVLVYDAGAEIDPLLKFDDGIKLAHEILPQFKDARNPKSIKKWNRVALHWLQMPGGRDRMTKAFDPKEERPWPTQVAAEFLSKSFGHQEGPVLVVMHKDDGGRLDVLDKLREELTGRGFAWDRVQVTTWGQADASNQFQKAIGGVLLGVLRLPKWDLQAMALAQTSDANLRPLPTPAETHVIDMAQTASRIYQAIGRCQSRQNGSDGYAKPSRWLVINWEREPLEIAVRDLMPGARLLDWPAPEYAKQALVKTRTERRERDQAKAAKAGKPPKARRESMADRAAARVFGHIQKAAEFAREELREVVMSKDQLRELAGVSKRTFGRVMADLEGDLWELGVTSDRHRVTVEDPAGAF